MILGHTTLKHNQIFRKIVVRKVKYEMLGVVENYKKKELIHFPKINLKKSRLIVKINLCNYQSLEY